MNIKDFFIAKNIAFGVESEDYEQINIAVDAAEDSREWIETGTAKVLGTDITYETMILSLNRLLNKFSAVLLMLCLFTNESKAQLEFSNWIIGKNTILHIDSDGKTQLINQPNIGYIDMFDNDNKNSFILSDNNGVPKITIGHKVYKYDKGLAISSGGVWKFDVFN